MRDLLALLLISSRNTEIVSIYNVRLLYKDSTTFLYQNLLGLTYPITSTRDHLILRIIRLLSAHFGVWIIV